MPGQYFILKFDFSAADRSPDVTEADQLLKTMIADDLKQFCKNYAMYLGGDAPKIILPNAPAASISRCVRLASEVLEDARRRGDKALADVRGVRMTAFI